MRQDSKPFMAPAPSPSSLLWRLTHCDRGCALGALGTTPETDQPRTVSNKKLHSVLFTYLVALKFLCPGKKLVFLYHLDNSDDIETRLLRLHAIKLRVQKRLSSIDSEAKQLLNNLFESFKLKEDLRKVGTMDVTSFSNGLAKDGPAKDWAVQAHIMYWERFEELIMTRLAYLEGIILSYEQSSGGQLKHL